MDILARAVELAGLHHAGAVDKAGKPYIMHPLAVMRNTMDLTNNTALLTTLAASVMHDLIEDTKVTAGYLLDVGFTFETVELVQVLSRDKATETYEQFIERIAGHRTITGTAAAAVIKMADILDNISVLRLDPEKFGDKDFNRLRQYRRAYARLESVVGAAWKV